MTNHVTFDTQIAIGASFSIMCSSLDPSNGIDQPMSMNKKKTNMKLNDWIKSRHLQKERRFFKVLGSVVSELSTGSNLKGTALAVEELRRNWPRLKWTRGKMGQGLWCRLPSFLPLYLCPILDQSLLKGYGQRGKLSKSEKISKKKTSLTLYASTLLETQISLKPGNQ